MLLGALDLHRLRVDGNLFHDEVYLLQLQVHDVIHQTLSHPHMLPEQLVVKVGILGKSVLHVAIQVDAQQTARVVGAKGNLTAGIGRDGAEAQIGIAVGNALTQDGVPEQHARLGTLPCVVDNLLPQLLGGDFLLPLGGVAVDGKLLHVWFVIDGSLHELVVNLHGDVGTRHLPLGHLGVDESLGVGVLDADAQHQCATATVLGNLACTITITLHKRHQTC